MSLKNLAPYLVGLSLGLGFLLLRSPSGLPDPDGGADKSGKVDGSSSSSLAPQPSRPPQIRTGPRKGDREPIALAADAVIEDHDLRSELNRLYEPTMQEVVSGRWPLSPAQMSKLIKNVGPQLEKWKELESANSGESVIIDLAHVEQRLFFRSIPPLPIEDAESLRRAVSEYFAAAKPNAGAEDTERATAFAMMDLGVTLRPRVIQGTLANNVLSGKIMTLRQPDDFKVFPDGSSTESSFSSTAFRAGDPRLSKSDGRFAHLVPRTELDLGSQSN